MNIEPNLICFPEQADYRFILGHKANHKNLLVIALNPNFADAKKHDGTSRNIQKIAMESGFNGWALVNLSSFREAKPDDIADKVEKGLMDENFSQFKALVDDKSWNISDVWLAWGNDIMKRDYLRVTAIKMLKHLKHNSSINFVVIGRTIQHHPYHCSQRVLNIIFKNKETRLQPFPALAYKELILENGT